MKKIIAICLASAVLAPLSLVVAVTPSVKSGISADKVINFQREDRRKSKKRQRKNRQNNRQEEAASSEAAPSGGLPVYDFSKTPSGPIPTKGGSKNDAPKCVGGEMTQCRQ